MLESLRHAERRLTPPFFGATSRRFCSHRTFPETGQRGSPKVPGGAARCFLSAEDGIAEHFGNCFSTTSEMNLETVGLFFRAPFRIDAPDVFF